MGEAHGAVGWAPDEVLLEQTLEVLRASQSHSNETQADVQQVGAPAHTPTHTHTHAHACPCRSTSHERTSQTHRCIVLLSRLHFCLYR
jgi:hypothetical protein